MKRRDFVLNASLSAISISTFGFVNKISEDSFKGNCETTDDILGPFYRPEAPTRQDLTYQGLEGSQVEIKGRVYEEDCSTPIKNALVEIWHCNTRGRYDNRSSDFNQRAKWYSDKNGDYMFRTILPGKYLNGSQYRPAHIHFRVTAPGSNELISQIYFQGDPHIENDPWASAKNAEKRILPISLEDTDGSLVVNFDIYLQQS